MNPDPQRTLRVPAAWVNIFLEVLSQQQYTVVRDFIAKIKQQSDAQLVGEGGHRQLPSEVELVLFSTEIAFLTQVISTMAYRDAEPILSLFAQQVEAQRVEELQAAAAAAGGAETATQAAPTGDVADEAPTGAQAAPTGDADDDKEVSFG